jgi:hypothetical protein
MDGRGPRHTHRIAVGPVDLAIDTPETGAWFDLASRLVSVLGPGTKAQPEGNIVCGVPVARPPGEPDTTNEEVGAALWSTIEAPVVELPAGRIEFSGSHTVRLDAAPDVSPAEIGRLMMPHALGWLLTHHQIWLLHAAAVVPPDGADSPGSAIVITGPSGQGKSTCAVAALEADWAVLADDMVLLRRAYGGLEVQGLRFPLSAPADLVGVRTPAVPIEHDLRRRRSIGRPGSVPLANGWWPVGAVALVGHGDHTLSAATRIDSVTTVRSLWLSVFGAPGRSRIGAWFALAAELSRLDSYELSIGTDPADRLASTLGALREIDRRLVPAITNNQSTPG